MFLASANFLYLNIKSYTMNLYRNFTNVITNELKRM